MGTRAISLLEVDLYYAAGARPAHEASAVDKMAV